MMPDTDLRPLERMERAILGYEELDAEYSALREKFWPDPDWMPEGSNWREYLPDNTDPADADRYGALEELLNAVGEEFHAALNAYAAAPESEQVAARLKEAAHA